MPAFIHVVPIVDTAFYVRLRAELDEGESEAIVLARELKADELLIDEADGRRVAVREGIQVIGLLGVVLEAKGRGLVPSVRELTRQLETDARFYVANAVKEIIFRGANEL